MIKIDRIPCDSKVKVYHEAKFKSRDGMRMITKAERETEDAIAFFTDPRNYSGNKKFTDAKFSFRVYKDEEVVAALDVCFHGKCAYCESYFAHVTPIDVEHYRPKSEVTDGEETLVPGYYWLAADWDNLLASCPDCNRARKHEVPGQPKKVKLGKLAQFPLVPGTQRVRASTGDLQSEESGRLLLNPCLDEPENHLTFDDEGLIYARKDVSGNYSEKGLMTIYVCALQRKGLVEARKVVLLKFQEQANHLEHLVKMHPIIVRAGNIGDVEENLQQIDKVSKELKSFFNERAPFQAMLRDYIRRTKNAGGFNLIQEFGIHIQDLINC